MQKIINEEKIVRSDTVLRNPLQWLGLCCGLMLTFVFTLSAELAFAQAWKPTRPVEFVVPANAGGTLDRPARLLQKIWQESKMLDVPVVNAHR